MTALLRLAGILFVAAVVRVTAALAVGPPPQLPPAPNRLSELKQQTDSTVAQAERRRRPLEEGERIQVNRASEEDLDRLPRVGPNLARAILTERERGGFADARALTRVRGVGPATAQKLAPFLDFQGAGSVTRRDGLTGSNGQISLARATQKELESLPGIGPALAVRILAARADRKVISVEDLIKVPGIGPMKLAGLRGRVRP